MQLSSHCDIGVISDNFFFRGGRKPRKHRDGAKIEIEQPAEVNLVMVMVMVMVMLMVMLMVMVMVMVMYIYKCAFSTLCLLAQSTTFSKISPFTLSRGTKPS